MFWGSLLIALFIAISPQIISTVESFMLRVVGAFFIIVCAFFFVTVSSRIVGLIAFYALKVGGKPSWNFHEWMGGMDFYISFGIFLLLAYYLLRTAMSRPESA